MIYGRGRKPPGPKHPFNVFCGGVSLVSRLSLYAPDACPCANPYRYLLFVFWAGGRAGPYRPPPQAGLRNAWMVIVMVRFGRSCLLGGGSAPIARTVHITKLHGRCYYYRWNQNLPIWAPFDGSRVLSRVIVMLIVIVPPLSLYGPDAFCMQCV